MVSSYLTTSFKNRVGNKLENQEFVYKIFQLLGYLKKVDSFSSFLLDQNYQIISFKFKDFLTFIGENDNHYQVTKLGGFFRSLQTLPPMLSAVSNSCFKSINIFPYVKVFKKRSWYVQFAIAEEVYNYNYNYPFYFPQEFLNCQDKYRRQVQVEFFFAFSVKEIEKVFDVEEFFSQFTISNSNLRKVGSYLSETFVLAQKNKMIENELVLVLKTNKEKKTTKLTPNLISRSKLINFKEFKKCYYFLNSLKLKKVSVFFFDFVANLDIPVLIEYFLWLIEGVNFYHLRAMRRLSINPAAVEHMRSISIRLIRLAIAVISGCYTQLRLL